MNLEGFRKAKFKRPVEEVAVPEMKDWFAEGEDQVICCRGLTSNQLFLAKEVAQKNNPIRALIKAFSSGKESEMTDAFRRYTSLTDETTVETAYRTELLLKGVVDKEQQKPFLQQADGVRLAEHFPEIFIRLTDKITALSGVCSRPD